MATTAKPKEATANKATTAIAEPDSAATSDHVPADHVPSDHVIDAISNNTKLIEQLLDQVASLQPAAPQANCAPEEDPEAQLQLTSALDEIAELQHRNEHLLTERGRLIADLQSRDASIAELRKQTDDLASQVAQGHAHQAVATDHSGTADALSWDQRKQLILKQMEDDTFDAERFVQSLSSPFVADEESEEEAEPKSAEDLITELVDRIEATERELVARNEEIGELKALLEQQSETREGGVAIGAAAIAQLVDSDELVMQERERLQLLQDQWEEKFRACEIEASLERAKLSRERQEVAKANEELQEQLAQIRREEKQSEETGGATSRRWFAKLGLSEEE